MSVLRYILDSRPGSEVKAGVHSKTEKSTQIKGLKWREIMGKSQIKQESYSRNTPKKEVDCCVGLKWSISRDTEGKD